MRDTPKRSKEEYYSKREKRVEKGVRACMLEHNSIIHVQQNPRTTAAGEELDASVFLFDDVSAFQQDFA